jgi:hypothetical protein
MPYHFSLRRTNACLTGVNRAWPVAYPERQDSRHLHRTESNAQ